MKKILLSALIAISITSCKKDNTTPNTPSGVERGKLISKIVVNNSNNTISTTKYNYDLNNHVTDANWSMNDGSDKIDYTLTYNADGSLKDETFTRSTSLFKREYTYVNGAPTLIKHTESLGNASNSYAVKIKTEGKFTTEGTFYNYDLTAAGSTTKFEYQNNNMVKETSEYQGKILQTTVYEYGTKKNPHLYSGNPWSISFLLKMNNANDLLKETSTSVGQVTLNIYTNTYDKDGYPIKVVKNTTQVTQGVSNPYLAQSTTVYTYINAK